MKKVALTLILAILVVLVAVPAFAQGTGAVKGKVVDEKGQPQAKATVELLDPATKKKYKGETDKGGEFLIKDVPAGIYKITMSHDGQARWAAEGFEVKAGQESTALIDLAAAKKMAELSEEEKKKLLEQAKKAEQERTKIKGINQKLGQAKQLEQAGDMDGALAIYQETVDIDPSKDLLWANLGGALLTKGGKTTDRAAKAELGNRAIEAYQKALAIKNDPAYHNNLGQAYALASMNKEAAQEYTTAANLDPVNAGQYWYNLGAVLTNTGQTEEANAAFDKALAADPNKAEAYYWKGVNLLAKATIDPKTNKTVAPPGTAESFNKYLELQPDGRFAQPAKELLASLGAEIQTTYKKTKGAKK